MIAGSDPVNHAAWLVRLRWIAIAAAAGVIAVATFAMSAIPRTNAIILFACVGALALLNVWVRRVILQIAGDLVVLTALLHFSGGISNPFHVIYLFHVVLASIILEAPAARGVTLAACGLFTLLAVAEFLGWIPHHGEPVTTVRFAGGLAAFNVAMISTFYLTRAAAKELSDSRRRLEAVVDGAGVGMRLLDHNRMILWQNRRITEWFGEVPVVGRACLLAFGKPVLGCTAAGCICEVAARTSSERQGERFVKGRRYVASAFPLRDERGEVRQIVEVIRDVTQERETAAQLVQAAKLTGIGELAASVAHEVNNPIGIIIGKVRLLLSRRADELPGPVIEELRKIDEQANRVAGVTKALLGFSRPSTGQLERVDVRAVVEESLSLTRGRLDGIRLETVLPEDLPRVTGNTTGLQQVLVNVINNAIDAMPEGGSLRIAAGRADGRVELSVTDSGVGIEKENLPRIFDPFYTTKGPKGTGLGLAIARRIVRDHNGDLAVESEVGKGTSFRITLPEAKS